jgi:hypothetical protein
VILADIVLLGVVAIIIIFAFLWNDKLNRTP